jgi:hypothetical protein
VRAAECGFMWEMALAAEPSARGASVAQSGATLHLAPSSPLGSKLALRAFIAIIAKRTFVAVCREASGI